MGYITFVSKICKFCGNQYEVPKHKEFSSSYCSKKCCISGIGQLRSRPLLERFKEKMDLIDINGCINWLGTKDNKGYGKFFVKKINNISKQVLAHRMAYILFKGEIPLGHEVCHSCDNPLCVNVDHLWIGKHRDNMKDMIQKKRDRFGGRIRK